MYVLHLALSTQGFSGPEADQISTRVAIVGVSTPASAAILQSFTEFQRDE